MKKCINTLFLFLIVVLLTSCRAKKIERTEIRQSDTIVVKRETIKGDFNQNGVKDGFVDVPHFERQK